MKRFLSDFTDYTTKNILQHCLLVVFLCGLCTPSSAQKKVISTKYLILSKIRAMKNDTNKVNAYFTYDHYILWQNEQTPDVFNEVTALCKKLDFPKGIVIANIMQSNWFLEHGSYLKGLGCAREALTIARKNVKEYEEEALQTLAEVYFMLQDFEKSVAYNHQVLQMYKQKKQDINIAFAYSMLARSYGEWKKYEKAIFYDQKAIDIADKLNDKSLKASIYSGAAWHFYLTKQFLQAYIYCHKTIDILGEDNADSYSAIGTLGSIFLDAPDSLLAKMGTRIEERYQKALYYNQKSLEGSLKSRFKVAIRDSYYDLHRIYKNLGDYRKAYDAYVNYVVYRDSTANTNQQMAVLKNEAEARETKLKFEQRLTQAYYLSGILVLLIISFFIARNYFTQRKLNKIISIEKKRSDDLLNNILPADVAEELKAKGFAKARQFDQVTVLFTDFVKFTTHSETLAPQELVDELNYCFSAFDDIITKYGLEKIKTIGDAYLAVSGLPNAASDHAVQAVHAAIAIRDFMAIRRDLIGDKIFDIRIGLHSGSVVAGIVGVKKFAYDIWGDTVNTAARMEQHSVAGKINVSEDTMELLKEEFILSYRGEIEAKNKGLLKMYFVDQTIHKLDC